MFLGDFHNLSKFFETNKVKKERYLIRQDNTIYQNIIIKKNNKPTHKIKKHAHAHTQANKIQFLKNKTKKTHKKPKTNH